MRILFPILATCLFSTGCDLAIDSDVPALDPLVLEAGKKDALRYLGDGAEIIAVCGGSSGVGFYLDDKDSGFEKDTMESGLIVFAIDADGNPEIVHRDALKEMIVVSESGATLTKISDFQEEDKRLGVWIATHPASGVVETYNLSVSKDGEPIALWNANKSSNILRARTFTYVANCEFN